MISYIHNSPFSRILDTSEKLLDFFMAMPSLSTQVNLIKTPKKTNDATINSNEIDQSKCFEDKMFKEAKFNGLKTIIIKSISKVIAVLMKNEGLRFGKKIERCHTY